MFSDNEATNNRIKDKVKVAFESLKRAGRPDIEIDKKNITADLYVDLKENDLILKEAKNHLMHTFFIGKKGTGKSTIFLKAIDEAEEGYCGFYINLQTCYEYASDEGEFSDVYDEKIKRILLRNNFLLKFLDQLNELLKEHSGYFEKIKIEKELEKISKIIENGKEININETTKIWKQKVKEIGKEKGIGGSLSLGSSKLEALYKKFGKDIETNVFETVVQKYFSITDIINSIYKISKDKISKIIIFLDDYSELEQEIQLIVANFILAPIIASYSQFIVFKVAAYPGRIEYGPNIDQTKINKEYLDYYDIYKGFKKYDSMKNESKEYIKRILEKRLEIIISSVRLENLFDSKKSINDYLEILADATINNPRALGYILSYAYEKTININKKIDESSLNSAIESYCLNHILAEFNNDKRYKSSFTEKENILDLYTQQRISETIINKAKELKEIIIKKFNNREIEFSVPEAILSLISNYRRGIKYFIPTSHFHVNIGCEKYLKTLELYFIISKLNELSSKDGRQQLSIYSINYGICLLNNIDYGSFQEHAKYWQERIWNYQDIIESVINALVEIKCSNPECNYTFKQDEIETIRQYNFYCRICNTKNSVKIHKKYPPTLMAEAAKRKKNTLPDHYIDVLRCLYNHQNELLLSKDISFEIDKNISVVVGALRSLSNKNLIKKVVSNKNYWKITSNAIAIYFEKN